MASPLCLAGSGTCWDSFLPTSRLGNGCELWAAVCWPQQGLGEGDGEGMAPCCWTQTAASAQRGFGSKWGWQDSANLVPREAEGDTGAKAGQLKLLPCPALCRTDVTSKGSSMFHWQEMKLNKEPKGPGSHPLSRCQESRSRWQEKLGSLPYRLLVTNLKDEHGPGKPDPATPDCI